MNKKEIKKISISILIGLIILLGLLSILKIANQENKARIELIQLSSQTNNRMMGYIVRTNDNKTIVIDGGMDTDANNLIKYIKNYENKVDYWFITHPHMDHSGAFINIIENTDIQIGHIYYTINTLDWYKTYDQSRTEEIENFFKVINNEKINNIKEEVNIGDNIAINENIKIEILGIKNPEITINPINNSSMVFKLYVNDKSILFLGDTGKESSLKLIEKYGENLKSDIVQMAHHGQDGAVEELYKLVKPSICLWSTPEWLWNNDAGQGYNTGTWKTLETRKWIDELGVQTNYVAKDGDITIIVE